MAPQGPLHNSLGTGGFTQLPLSQFQTSANFSVVFLSILSHYTWKIRIKFMLKMGQQIEIQKYYSEMKKYFISKFPSQMCGAKIINI